MPEKKYKWYRIAGTMAELHFSRNNIVQAEIAGKQICIVKTPDGLSACTAKCPHAGGNMAEGFVDKDGNIGCPVHRYMFSLKNGRDIMGEGYFLKTYPVRVNDAGIFLGIEDAGLFSWLK